MKVSRLPIDPGPAAWADLLPPAAAAQRLEGKQTADWLVIGGGFAGLAALARLKQLHPADKIILLEASRIADGPAGRNSGFMIDLPHDLASEDYGGALNEDQQQIAANRAAIAFARQMAEEFELPCEAFNPCGKFNAAASAKGHRHNQDYARHLTHMGEPWEMYDAAQMAELTGTGYYQSGLFTPGTVMLQPAMYIRGIARGLASHHALIFENSPVTALEHNGDWSATTPSGQVTAPRVILAVNGHANSFGLYPQQLIHVFTYASMTRALTAQEVKTLGGARNWGATPADPLGTTVRRISGMGGDRIIIRNRATFDPSMQVSERRIRAVSRSHDASFSARFPALRHVSMQYRWGGRLCLSRNNVAAFGEVMPGLYSACCQNGLGTAKGTLHGMLAADLASGHDSPLLQQVQEQAAPRRLPPPPLAWLGANALMKWGEWTAGAEL